MFKNFSFIILGTVITTSLTCNDSFANYVANPYISGHAGYMFRDNETGNDEISNFTENNKSGYNTGFAIGAEIYKNFRAEAEFSYQKSRTTGFDSDPEWGLYTTVYSYMGNAYYDFKNRSNFTPYIGGGLGVAHTKFNDKNDNTSLTDTEFAYQGMAGIGYNINKNNLISLGYRYFGINDFQDGPFKVAYDKNSIEIGYSYRF